MNKWLNQLMEWWKGLSRQYRIIVLAVAALLIVLVLFLFANRTYTDYRVVSEFEQKAEEGDEYDTFGGWIVQYGNDGITCFADDGTLKWSTSYEMSLPMLAKSDSYIAIGDMGGNTVYLFDENGYVNRIETTKQIFRLDVSDNGTVATVLQSKGVSYLELVGADGTLIADADAHIDDSGYPISVALTPDGETMAVAYMTVDMGTLSTRIVFYHFGSAGSNSNHEAASFTYNGLLIPKIEYLDNSKLAAFGDTQLQIYAGGSKPQLQSQIDLEAETISVFTGTDVCGVVSRNDSNESSDAGAYKMTVYSSNGTLKFTQDFDLAYTNITCLANGEISIRGNRAAEILSTTGHPKFDATFEEKINGVFSTSNENFYDLIFENRVERVRLH